MDFLTTDDIYCHHITPRSKGGTDEYGNLILVLEPIHRLIHAVKKEIVEFYLNLLNLNDKQLEKLNTHREKAGMPKIA